MSIIHVEICSEHLVSVDGHSYPRSCLELKLCNYMNDLLNLNIHAIFNVLHTEQDFLLSCDLFPVIFQGSYK